GAPARPRAAERRLRARARRLRHADEPTRAQRADPRRVRRPRRDPPPHRRGERSIRAGARGGARHPSPLDRRRRPRRPRGLRGHRRPAGGRLRSSPAMSRYLYLVRHGEQQDAEHGLPDGPLSARGVRQAHAIAERLGGVPFTGAWTSPLQRAQETARIMTWRIPSILPQSSSLVMDRIPPGPDPAVLHTWEPFCGAFSREEIEAGNAQMADATAE